MAEGERNAEIWSTRVQKELLALTTDDADLAETAEARVTLPPFCNVLSHTLNINEGTCEVSFQLEIGKGEQISKITVKLNVSLPRTGNEIDTSATCYPMAPPLVTLVSGMEAFPKGSTIQENDRISMDLDWTPSLHLTDAVMNVSLKIKESILQDEPFHPAPKPTTSDAVAQGAMRFAAGFSKALGRKDRKKKSPKKKKKRQTPTPGEVRINDEINLLEEPWVNAHGIYSCKAIRRPQFLEDAMALAAEKDDQEALGSPSNMFRSFTQSARSVLEESFLMVTATHIIEIKASKLNMSTGKIAMAVPIELMAKLKFRRQESVSLFFKPAPEDPLVYMCPDSGDAVHQIQSVLKQHGVRGKHTNAAAHRAINEALSLVQEIQTKELALKHDPTLDRVNEIMDLYRQAAERFEVAGDIRHEEVVTHMRKFLALPLTASILDGTFVKPEPETPTIARMSGSGVPEGEVLAKSPHHLDDLDAPGGSQKEKENDKAFEENIDNLLKEAQADADQLQTSSSDVDVAETGSSLTSDLDAMMQKADEELAELMSS